MSYEQVIAFDNALAKLSNRELVMDFIPSIRYFFSKKDLMKYDTLGDPLYVALCEVEVLLGERINDADNKNSSN